MGRILHCMQYHIFTANEVSAVCLFATEINSNNLGKTANNASTLPSIQIQYIILSTAGQYHNIGC